MRRHSFLTPRWLTVTAVLLFFWLALSSLVDDSPTMDEQNHIGRGLAFVRTGDPRLSLEHPPLINSLSALPLLLMPELRVPFDHPSWLAQQPPDTYWYVFGDLLLWEYGNDARQMVFLVRLPIVWLTLALGLVGYTWARQLWGRPAAPLALVLLLFEPNVLAHGRYTTTDLGGTLFVFLAGFLLWRLWHGELKIEDRKLIILNSQFSIFNWFLAAVGMGLAFGSKLSTLTFVPIFGVMALLPGNSRSWSWRRAGQRLLQFGSAGLLSVGLVWTIFGFEWGAFRFNQAPLSALNHYAGPMPTYWAGIAQILDLTGGGRQAYLLGDYSREGFALYFPVTYLAKTPLILLLVLPLASIWLLRARATRRGALFLLVPALLYFAITMQSDLNLGYRHLLPMVPFLLLLISGLASPRLPLQAGRWAGGVTAVFLVATTLTIHPHYLSYFNWAAGGPANGYQVLLDSNVDWGQDLLRLQAWLAENEVEQVHFGWFGTADPAYYGLSVEPLPGFPRREYLSLWGRPPFDPVQPAPGVYAISVSNLMDFYLPDSGIYGWFRQQTPTDRVGYSILIYEVE